MSLVEHAVDGRADRHIDAQLPRKVLDAVRGIIALDGCAHMPQRFLDQLRAACEALKEPYRSTALLYFVRERSFQEIADDTGQNLKTVQTRVYRAKAQLKKMIRREQVL